MRFLLPVLRPFFAASLLIVVSALSAQVVDSSPWYQGGTWEHGPFGDDLAAYRQSADLNHYPKPLPVTVFLREGTMIFHEDGSLDFHVLLVYRIENDEGIANWSDSQVGWSPWFQDHPELKVRLVNPDGQVSRLTEKDMIVVASGSDDSKVYQDDQTLKVPYPNVKAGTLVEEEVVTHSRPFLPGAGVASAWSFARSYPVGLSRLTITHPVARPFRYKASALPGITPAKASDGKTETLTWEIRNQAVGPDFEHFVPPEARQGSSVSASSADGWDQIAQGYSNEIEQVLGQKPLQLKDGPSLPAGDARAATLAASRWVNSRVRYTGLELGKNSIVPFSPEAILGRGYGDCKDKATLLVALLRSAGYRAWVSLIETGPGWDVDPDLPTMNDFNHAIVFVDGSPGFWFDPTVDVTRTTSLPYYDQYRYTLIARAGQKELSRTAQAPGADNRIWEHRDYVMADEGNGTVTERTDYTGIYDTDYRNTELFEEPKKARENLENYVKNYYSATTTTSAEWGDPRDFGSDYHVTVSASGTNQVVTGDTDAEATFHLNNLKSVMVKALLEKDEKPRTQPFRFNLAFVYRLTTTIHPAPGFVPRSIPDPVLIDKPAFTFQRTWTCDQDGTAVCDLTFALKRLQYSADEYSGLAKDFQALFETQNEQKLIYDHRAEELRAEGKYAQAFETYRKLLADHPDSAVQYKRLSRALVSYSLGDPAATYARKATELAPSNASLWANLANILACDPLGRRLMPGYDREGTIAAWQKAIALDPDNKNYHANLAIIEEYDRNGDRYLDLDGLKLARKEYEGLGKAIQDFQLGYNEWMVAVRLGDYAAARTFVPLITDDNLRNVARITTEMLAGSTVPPAKLVEQGLTLEKRQQAWAGASDVMVALRHYTEAADLLKQAAVASNDAAKFENQADILGRMKVWNEADRDRSTPQGLVENFLFDLLRKTQPAADVLGAYGARSLVSLVPTLGESRVVASLNGVLRGVLGTNSPQVLTDYALSLFGYSVNGSDATGYRIDARIDGSHGVQFLVVKEDGAYRLVSWLARSQPVARQVATFLDAGNTEAAATWFGWLFTPVNGIDTSPLALQGYSQGALARNPWVMRWLAAEMEIFGNTRERVDPVADRLWPVLQDRDRFVSEAKNQGVSADLAPGLWACLVFNLADAAASAGSVDRAQAIAKTVAPYETGVPGFVRWYAIHQVLWGAVGQGEAAIEAYQAANPDDTEAIKVLLKVYEDGLDFPKLNAAATRFGDRLGSMDFNNLAWAQLFRNPRGTPAPETLEWARKAANLPQEGDAHAVLNTVAAVYATVGRFDEARSALIQGVNQTAGKQPAPEDWYVVGLIAQGYGFTDAARAAWSRVPAPTPGASSGTDTYTLAQARLNG